MWREGVARRRSRESGTTRRLGRVPRRLAHVGGEDGQHQEHSGIAAHGARKAQRAWLSAIQSAPLPHQNTQG